MAALLLVSFPACISSLRVIADDHELRKTKRTGSFQPVGYPGHRAVHPPPCSWGINVKPQEFHRRTGPGRIPSVRSQTVLTASANTLASYSITLHIGDADISFPFSMDGAKGLDAAFSALLQTFREKEKAERPRRWESMEFRHCGDGGSGSEILLEVFCNPNAYANAFQAKALVTLKGGSVKFTGEGPLSALKADIDQFLSSH
eukprot:TRINITY_DN738_c0_g1_i2.p1 TRINITY_DN738_c0_g1~~TRINITY_DN738_c0_g1_i2.p1  ORF type:complete len:224 (-),score=29.95 TRINITY_DN738_c0_g1_i2:263-871(-)